MKTTRAIALNHAFIAFCILGVIALIGLITNTPLTEHSYQIPTYYYSDMGIGYVFLPPLPVYWLVVIGTLFVFGISYITHEWKIDSKNSLSGSMAGIITGIIIGTITAVLSHDSKGIYLGLVAGAGCGFLANVITKPGGFMVFSLLLGASIASTDVFLLILFRTPLGIGEAIVCGGVTFLVFTLLLATANAATHLVRSLWERLHLIMKTPEMKGTSRTN